MSLSMVRARGCWLTKRIDTEGLKWRNREHCEWSDASNFIMVNLKPLWMVWKFWNLLSKWVHPNNTKYFSFTRPEGQILDRLGHENAFCFGFHSEQTIHLTSCMHSNCNILLTIAVRFLLAFPSAHVRIPFQNGWSPVLHATVVPRNFELGKTYKIKLLSHSPAWELNSFSLELISSLLKQCQQ